LFSFSSYIGHKKQKEAPELDLSKFPEAKIDSTKLEKEYKFLNNKKENNFEIVMKWKE